MLNFLKSIYRTVIEIVFWVILIVGAIVGYMAFGILGAILGIVAGLVFDILCGGLVATILVIEKNTAETLELLELLRNGSRVDATNVPLMPSHNVAGKSAADTQGRTDVRSWWDSDGVKHESWVEADGTRHET